MFLPAEGGLPPHFESCCLLKNGGVSPTLWMPGQVWLRDTHSAPEISEPQLCPPATTHTLVSWGPSLVCLLAVPPWNSPKADPHLKSCPPVLGPSCPLPSGHVDRTPGELQKQVTPRHSCCLPSKGMLASHSPFTIMNAGGVDLKL